MFPAAKRRRGPDNSHGHAKKRKFSPGKPFTNDRGAKSPKRNGTGGPHRDKTGKDQRRTGWKKPGDREKPFGKKMSPGGKTFRANRRSDGDNKYGGKKKYEGNKTFGGKNSKDKPFRSKGQKGNMGFKKKGAGFKQKKGKG